MKFANIAQVLMQVAETSEGTAENQEVNVTPVSREELQASLVSVSDDGTEKPLSNRDAVLAAFDSGDISVEHTNVGRNIEGKGRIEKPYIRLTANNLKGALAIVGGKESDVWTKFNVGFDMGVRSTLGQQIVRENEGPEKYLAQAAKYFSKMFRIPLEVATEQLKGMLESGAISPEGLQEQAAQAEQG